MHIKITILILSSFVALSACSINNNNNGSEYQTTKNIDEVDNSRDGIGNIYLSGLIDLGSGLTFQQKQSETNLLFQGHILNTWQSDSPIIPNIRCNLMDQKFEEFLQESKSGQPDNQYDFIESKKEAYWNSLDQKNKNTCLHEYLANHLNITFFRNNTFANINLPGYESSGPSWIIDLSSGNSQKIDLSVIDVMKDKKYTIIYGASGYSPYYISVYDTSLGKQIAIVEAFMLPLDNGDSMDPDSLLSIVSYSEKEIIVGLKYSNGKTKEQQINLP